MADLSDLPDELQQEGKPRPKRIPKMSEAQRTEKLEALGAIIAKKRDAAVKARKDSGIEDIWTACEEAYLGIDDSNRADFAKAKWAKPTSMSGPVSQTNTKAPGNQSTAYVRLTTRYVDMGASKLAEMVLPIDDKAFSFSASPVPELVGQKEDKTPQTDANGQPIMRAAKPGEVQAPPAAPGGPPAAPQMVPVTAGDIAQAKMEEAEKKAKKAEQRIYDWMVESRYPMQMRKLVHDSARIGVGVLKAPFPDERTSKAVTTNDKGVVTLEINRKIKPGYKWIDAWNLFPHGSCGEDIHSGDHILERDFISASSIRALKKLCGPKSDKFPNGEPIYLADQIDKVLLEGPDKCNVEEGGKQAEKQDGRFTIWYFTGTLDREDMLLLGAPGADELPDEVTECFCIVTLVNDSPIRTTFNPLTKSGHYPYRTFPWSRRAGHWAGVGPGEQVALPQRMVNAGTRSWLNNAGISSGVQLFIDRYKFKPSDGDEDITPNKMWEVTAEGSVDDVNKFFAVVEIPNRGKELMEIINYAFKLAEEQSNIPLISQGQTGPQDPQTFGQAELQNNNANTLMRQLAYSLDDHITEPVVDDSYEMLLLDDDVPNDEKGDFKINARGSIVMVERAIQQQNLAQMVQMVQNPMLGHNPKKVFDAWLRGNRMNPEETKYTDEEFQQAMQNMPKAPAVQAAEVRAQVDIQKTHDTNQTRLQIASQDTDRDTAYNDSLARRDEIARKAALDKHHMDMELETLRYANARAISLEDAKKELAGLAIKLNVQRELSADSHAVDLHKHRTDTAAPQAITPPTEPAGRAPAGQAWQA